MIQALAASLVVIAAAAPEKAPPVAEVYKTHCQACHMADGQLPARAAELRGRHLETRDRAGQAWRRSSPTGVPGTAMLPFNAKLTPAEVQALAAYVRAFDKNLKPSKAPTKKK